MTEPQPTAPVDLPPERLRRRCDPAQFPFATTAELDDLDEALGQQRATAALRFGIDIRREGYHLFAMGSEGSGRHTIVRRHAEAQAKAGPAPADWCYVFDFAQPNRPRALRLPTGKAAGFRDAMARLVVELRTAIPAAFETDEYRAQRQALEEEFGERQEQAIAGVRQHAEQQGATLLRTPAGFAFAPVRDGEAMATEAFDKLPQAEQERITATIEALQTELEQVIRELPKWRRQAQQKLRELNRTVTQAAVENLIEELEAAYADLPAVVDHLHKVRHDVLDHAEQFHARESEAPTLFGLPLPRPDGAESVFRRYAVNVLVDHSGSPGAPVVYEDHPTHDNLVGRIDHVAQMGTLVTDFSLIKAGALHRANGGYLILDARQVLGQPFAWEALKRALRSREIRTESLGQVLSLVSTISLQPEPIPLDAKVVLVGERLLYYLLHALDPDFAHLFKVVVDFDNEVDAGPGADLQYARMLAGIARRDGLLPFDRGAVAAVVEQGSRMVGDARKLSVHMRAVADLLREADYWAGAAGRKAVAAADVHAAIAAQRQRSDRLQSRQREAVLRGLQRIDTQGRRTGQVNGLSVVQLGDHAFGHPNRITARVRVGGGKVVDIEREVELGGPIHSKGVLILGGFLAGRYAQDRPLSLAATLVFEQSYGGVEGDSASSAELYALLSALAGLPLRQDLAVTGSVDQLGEVQAIGGVNEKIEGFFAVCRERGLTGDQGVLIPAANVQHLALLPEVVQAVAEGRFHVWAVATIDAGLELLTGVPAGERDAAGRFPADSVNGRVERRLLEFADHRRRFRGAGGEDRPS
jgi:predicted ATP-dependent protease